MEEKVKEWIQAKQKLANVKAAELELRNSICEHILSGKIKGAKKGVIGPYTLTATAKLNAKLDKDLLKVVWADLIPGEKAAFRFKPEIIAAKYKLVDKKSKIHSAITHKPGTPALELKGVKDGN